MTALATPKFLSWIGGESVLMPLPRKTRLMNLSRDSYRHIEASRIERKRPQVPGVATVGGRGWRTGMRGALWLFVVAAAKQVRHDLRIVIAGVIQAR